MKKISFLGALTGASLCCLQVATASTFNFSYADVSTGGAIASASGILDVSPSGSNYLITGISGNYNGKPITSLYSVGGFQGNDNILYSGSPRLDVLGFAFYVAAIAQSFNVYYDKAGQFICAGCYGSYNGQDVVVNFSASATPLPAALPLFGGGLVLIAWAVRRRSRVTSA